VGSEDPIAGPFVNSASSTPYCPSRMEVVVESVGIALPENCHIAVRVGGVQKQARYDGKKLYRFPEARRFGKIDIFQHIGTCDFAWEVDQPDTRTCRVTGDTGETGVKLNVTMAPAPKLGHQQNPTEIKEQRAALSKDVHASAMKFLKDNDVEGILISAMRAALKSSPKDVPSFICDHIERNFCARKEKVCNPDVGGQQAASGEASNDAAKELLSEFAYRPSVGTWASGPSLKPLAQKRAKTATSENVAAARQCDCAEVTSQFKPSVGTWRSEPLLAPLRKPLQTMDAQVKAASRKNDAEAPPTEATADAKANGKSRETDEARVGTTAQSDAVEAMANGRLDAGPNKAAIRARARHDIFSAMGDMRLQEALEKARLWAGASAGEAHVAPASGVAGAMRPA